MRQAYGRIEQTAAEPREHPRVYAQREPESQGSVEQLRRRFLRCGRDDGASGVGVGGHIGGLSSREGQEQEEEGAHELTDHGNDVTASAGRQLGEYRIDHLMPFFAFEVHVHFEARCSRLGDVEHTRFPADVICQIKVTGRHCT